MCHIDRINVFLYNLISFNIYIMEKEVKFKVERFFDPNQKTKMEDRSDIEIKKNIVKPLCELIENGKTQDINLKKLREIAQNAIQTTKAHINTFFRSKTEGQKRVKNTSLLDNQLVELYLVALLIQNKLNTDKLKDKYQRQLSNHDRTKEVYDLDLDHTGNNNKLPEVALINYMATYLNDTTNINLLDTDAEIQELIDVAVKNFAIEYCRYNTYKLMYSMGIRYSYDPDYYRIVKNLTESSQKARTTFQQEGNRNIRKRKKKEKLNVDIINAEFVDNSEEVDSKEKGNLKKKNNDRDFNISNNKKQSTKLLNNKRKPNQKLNETFNPNDVNKNIIQPKTNQKIDNNTQLNTSSVSKKSKQVAKSFK